MGEMRYDRHTAAGWGTQGARDIRRRVTWDNVDWKNGAGAPARKRRVRRKTQFPHDRIFSDRARSLEDVLAHDWCRENGCCPENERFPLAVCRAGVWLEAFLMEAGGMRDNKVIKAVADVMGHKPDALHRARRRLGVDVVRVGRGSVWALPERTEA